jgi:DNA (cytosine-5)-methyltransferase 1
MLYGLDLFSGIGGISIALGDWVRPMAYCEIDPYCQGVLLSRISDGKLSSAPIWDDIKSLRSSMLPAKPDIIYGGFPCQDISVAGKGKGLEGERSGLFFEIMRLAEEIKPSFIFLENVPAITARGGLRVVREIAERGYDCRWCTLSAASVGAMHKRERWFLLAHSLHDGSSTSTNGGGIRKFLISGEGQEEQKKGFGETERASGLSSNVANSKSQQQDGLPVGTQEGQPSARNDSEHKSIHFWQKTVSEMGKCSNGIPYHTHRLRALGNAVVPVQAKKAFKKLMGIYDHQ